MAVRERLHGRRIGRPAPARLRLVPRVLGDYVRQRRVVGFAEAIRKTTSLAASNVGIANRGRIAPGAFADLVLLDTATVIDHVTPADPHAVSTGVAKSGQRDIGVC